MTYDMRGGSLARALLDAIVDLSWWLARTGGWAAKLMLLYLNRDLDVAKVSVDVSELK